MEQYLVVGGDNVAVSISSSPSVESGGPDGSIYGKEIQKILPDNNEWVPGHTYYYLRAK